MHVYSCQSEIPKVNFLLFIFYFWTKVCNCHLKEGNTNFINKIKSCLSGLVILLFPCTKLTHCHYCNFILLPDHPGLTKRNVTACPGKHQGTALGREVLTERVLIWPLAVGSRDKFTPGWYGFIAPAVQIIPSNTDRRLILLPQPLTVTLQWLSIHQSCAYPCRTPSGRQMTLSVNRKWKTRMRPTLGK